MINQSMGYLIVSAYHMIWYSCSNKIVYFLNVTEHVRRPLHLSLVKPIQSSCIQSSKNIYMDKTFRAGPTDVIDQHGGDSSSG